MIKNMMILLFIFTLNVHIFGQENPDKKFNEFSEKFLELLYDDPYIIKNYSDIDSVVSHTVEEADMYFSVHLYSQEYLYPVGKYTYDNFYCFRVQKLTIALPPITEEFLITVSKYGIYTAKILCGGFSENQFATYRTISKIDPDTIITTHIVTHHGYLNDTNKNETKIKIEYKLTDDGKFLKIEDK